MKSIITPLCLLSFVATPVLASAYEAIYTVGTNEQQCYAKAMIGFDSVINSRLGVVPEHALTLALKDNSGAGEEEYSKEILKTVLNAYLWKNSPHSYAIDIFYSCAAERGQLDKAGGASEAIFQ